MSASKDITGKTFGKLKAIKKVGSKNTHALWLMKCECGTEIKVTYSNLASKNTTQCKLCYNRSLKVISDDTMAEMIELRNSGESYCKIAEMYGLNHSTVYKAIRREAKREKKQ